LRSRRARRDRGHAKTSPASQVLNQQTIGGELEVGSTNSI
jgi:hypothetical protein